jgi:putative protease
MSDERNIATRLGSWPSPELLAPAGDWACARAAVQNGADAIYFGLDRFNARMRAGNFTMQGLPELMSFLHGRGVRGYVTFNILVFANELEAAEDYLRSIIAAGVDAAIVQDVGVCRLIRRLSPDFPLYASTQMSVTSAAGLEFAAELGCSLVALARECSIQEIERIQAERATACAGKTGASDSPPAPFPLEVFVHGALCVAYSGQCLTSESFGGRSANRGECAQACRLPYTLICDGQPVPLGDRRYLLSPQDLAGLVRLPDLIRAGVTSLKIEGRLKSPEYVANITRIYRRALDELERMHAEFNLESAACGGRETADRSWQQGVEASRYAMEMAFSRGLHTGWLEGIDHQKLVHGRFSKKRGVALGQVQKIIGQKVIIDLRGPLKPGDGVVFDAGHPEWPEEGGRVYSVERRGNDAALSFGRDDVRLDRIQVGDRVWKTSDPALDRELRQTFAGEAPRFTRPVQLTVEGHAGEPMRLRLRDEQGRVVETQSAMPLVEAHTRPLTTDRLEQQLGRLGGTPFHLAQLINHLAGPVMLPLAEMNRLRRELIRQLEHLRRQPLSWQLNPVPADLPTTVHQMLADVTPRGVSRDSPAAAMVPELIVLVRSLEQLSAVLTTEVRTIYCELEDPRKYREAVRRVRENPIPPRRAIWVAPPRITKPGEAWILEQVLTNEADGYLVRNYDHLKWFAGRRRLGDYTLNIANPLSAEFFMSRWGLERVTASYDLNFEQLEALLTAAPPEWFEVTVHQHMPLFHMEYCVFCACLTRGTDHTNCGRPCEQHQVQLRDRMGADHPIKADAGCRNTVFNARAQSGAEYVPRLVSLGVRAFRLEFLDESPPSVLDTIAQYRQLLAGQITGAQLWRALKLACQLGVTRGTLESVESRSIMPQ